MARGYSEQGPHRPSPIDRLPTRELQTEAVIRTIMVLRQAMEDLQGNFAGEFLASGRKETAPMQRFFAYANELTESILAHMLLSTAYNAQTVQNLHREFLEFFRQNAPRTYSIIVEKYVPEDLEVFLEEIVGELETETPGELPEEFLLEGGIELTVFIRTVIGQTFGETRPPSPHRVPLRQRRQPSLRPDQRVAQRRLARFFLEDEED